MRKVFTIAALLLASSVSLAQQQIAEPQQRPLSAAEINQQIKTLIATRQVYYERLEKITEFQQYIQVSEQLMELQKQMAAAQQKEKKPAP
jgi:shikimate kinase